MNKIIEAVAEFDVDSLVETCPQTALHTIVAIENAIDSQMLYLAQYREQIEKQRAEVERKLDHITVH